MTRAKVIGAVVVACLLMVVILQNTDSVETRVLGATITMPHAILLGTCLLLGFGLGALTSLYLVRRKDRRQGEGDAVADS